MNNRPDENQVSLSFKSGLKLLAIIACWETVIMIALAHIGPLPPWGAISVGTGSLTLLSGLSIWFLIILPEKKRAQKEILILGQELNAVDHIGIVSATDLHGIIIYANDNFCEISGHSREELIGNDHRILNSGHHSAEFFKEVWSTLKAGRPWRGEIRNKKKNGDFYWVDSYIIPIFTAEGKPCKYVSFRFDITADKNTEEALEQEKIKSIHMGRLSAIGQMAAGIAHEINNPLAIINGQLFNVERRLQRSNLNLEEEVPKILNSISKSMHQITRMTKIINGLQEFSRTSDSRPFETVSTSKILDSVKDLCADKLKVLGIRFEAQINEVEFQGNPVQIEQILINLINNSIDAVSDLERPWIRIEAVSQGDFVEISVTDSGPGIGPEMAEKIMQPFFTTKEVGKGTGLGLCISRGIVEKHRGVLYPDLSAKNTRFVVRIPLRESIAAPSAPAEINGYNGP
ncbi:MAG: PAS domain-containing sensor histidine kinase [Bacteriovorax sp.]